MGSWCWELRELSHDNIRLPGYMREAALPASTATAAVTEQSACPTPHRRTNLSAESHTIRHTSAPCMWSSTRFGLTEQCKRCPPMPRKICLLVAVES